MINFSYFCQMIRALLSYGDIKDVKISFKNKPSLQTVMFADESQVPFYWLPFEIIFENKQDKFDFATSNSVDVVINRLIGDKKSLENWNLLSIKNVTMGAKNTVVIEFDNCQFLN